MSLPGPLDTLQRESPNGRTRRLYAVDLSSGNLTLLTPTAIAARGSIVDASSFSRWGAPGGGLERRDDARRVWLGEAQGEARPVTSFGKDFTGGCNRPSTSAGRVTTALRSRVC